MDAKGTDFVEWPINYDRIFIFDCTIPLKEQNIEMESLLILKPSKM